MSILDEYYDSTLQAEDTGFEKLDLSGSDDLLTQKINNLDRITEDKAKGRRIDTKDYGHDSAPTRFLKGLVNSVLPHDNQLAVNHEGKRYNTQNKIFNKEDLSNVWNEYEDDPNGDKVLYYLRKQDGYKSDGTTPNYVYKPGIAHVSAADRYLGQFKSDGWDLIGEKRFNAATTVEKKIHGNEEFLKSRVFDYGTSSEDLSEQDKAFNFFGSGKSELYNKDILGLDTGTQEQYDANKRASYEKLRQYNMQDWQREDTFEFIDAFQSAGVKLAGQAISLIGEAVSTSEGDGAIESLGKKIIKGADKYTGYNPRTANKAAAGLRAAWREGDPLSFVANVVKGSPQWLAQSIPNMAAFAAVSGLGTLATANPVTGLMTGASVMGSLRANDILDKREEMNGGKKADLDEVASIYAASSMLSLLEYGALKFAFTGKTGAKIIDDFGKSISLDKVFKEKPGMLGETAITLGKISGGSIAEGSEEVVAGLSEHIMEKYGTEKYKGQKISDLLTSQEAIDTAVTSFGAGMGAGGLAATPRNIKEVGSLLQKGAENRRETEEAKASAAEGFADLDAQVSEDSLRKNQDVIDRTKNEIDFIKDLDLETTDLRKAVHGSEAENIASKLTIERLDVDNSLKSGLSKELANKHIESLESGSQSSVENMIAESIDELTSQRELSTEVEQIINNAGSYQDVTVLDGEKEVDERRFVLNEDVSQQDLENIIGLSIGVAGRRGGLIKAYDSEKGFVKTLLESNNIEITPELEKSIENFKNEEKKTYKDLIESDQRNLILNAENNNKNIRARVNKLKKAQKKVSKRGANLDSVVNKLKNASKRKDIFDISKDIETMSLKDALSIRNKISSGETNLNEKRTKNLLKIVDKLLDKKRTSLERLNDKNVGLRNINSVERNAIDAELELLSGSNGKERIDNIKNDPETSKNFRKSIFGMFRKSSYTQEEVDYLKEVNKKLLDLGVYGENTFNSLNKSIESADIDEKTKEFEAGENLSGRDLNKENIVKQIDEFAKAGLNTEAVEYINGLTVNENIADENVSIPGSDSQILVPKGIYENISKQALDILRKNGIDIKEDILKESDNKKKEPDSGTESTKEKEDLSEDGKPQAGSQADDVDSDGTSDIKDKDSGEKIEDKKKSDSKKVYAAPRPKGALKQIDFQENIPYSENFQKGQNEVIKIYQEKEFIDDEDVEMFNQKIQEVAERDGIERAIEYEHGIIQTMNNIESQIEERVNEEQRLRDELEENVNEEAFEAVPDEKKAIIQKIKNMVFKNKKISNKTDSKIC